MLEAARSEKTKAVMIAHTLGNPFDLSAVKAFCDKYNLWLVEDNCDALGSQYTLELNGERVTKFTGTVGDIGTSSFYPPHHIKFFKPVNGTKMAVGELVEKTADQKLVLAENGEQTVYDMTDISQIRLHLDF